MSGAMDFIGNEDEDTGIEDDSNPPREVRCRDCGSEDVYWALNNQNRWTLYNFNSRRHVCDTAVVSANRLDAFEDES